MVTQLLRIAGPFYYMNDVSVYLSRQRGPQLKNELLVLSVQPLEF